MGSELLALVFNQLINHCPNVNSLFNRVITAPTEFGFTNVTDSCLIGVVVCDNPNEYLFWDDYHPTTTADELIGELAFSALKPEPVPEPSAELALLLIGCVLGYRKLAQYVSALPSLACRGK